MSLYKWFIRGLTLAILGPYILAPIHYYNQKKAKDYSVSEFAIWSYSYVALHPPLCPVRSPGFICAAIDFSGLLHWSIAFFPRVCRCVLFKRLLFRHEFRNTHVQISMSEIQGYDIPPYTVVAISSFRQCYFIVQIAYAGLLILLSSCAIIWEFLCDYLRIFGQLMNTTHLSYLMTQCIISSPMKSLADFLFVIDLMH